MLNPQRGMLDAMYMLKHASIAAFCKICRQYISDWTWELPYRSLAPWAVVMPLANCMTKCPWMICPAVLLYGLRTLRTRPT